MVPLSILRTLLFLLVSSLLSHPPAFLTFYSVCLRSDNGLPGSGQWSTLRGLRSPGLRIVSGKALATHFVVTSLECFLKLMKCLLHFTLPYPGPFHTRDRRGKRKGVRWGKKVPVTPQKEASRRLYTSSWPHETRLSALHLPLLIERPRQGFLSLQCPRL